MKKNTFQIRFVFIVSYQRQYGHQTQVMINKAKTVICTTGNGSLYFHCHCFYFIKYALNLEAIYNIELAEIFLFNINANKESYSFYFYKEYKENYFSLY